MSASHPFINALMVELDRHERLKIFCIQMRPGSSPGEGTKGKSMEHITIAEMIALLSKQILCVNVIVSFILLYVFFGFRQTRIQLEKLSSKMEREDEHDNYSDG